MKRKPRTEFNAWHLFLGLLIGFLLGSTLVYWHSDRQNDRLISEAINNIMALFESHTIHLDSGDSIIVVRESSRQTVSEQTSGGSAPSPVNDEYFLAKDKLLYVKTVSIFRRDTLSDTSRRFDTLLGNNNQSSTSNLQNLVIEFWESPLNSVGYKMGKNKLVLYGIQSYDLVNIAEHKGKLYMKYSNEFYLLELTTQFKPLVPFNDPQLALDMSFF
jgi:hypothetical protein